MLDDRGVGEYSIIMYCINCKNNIDESKTKSQKYCCQRCAKLYLKSLYRKRNRDKIREYNRIYKQSGIRGNPCSSKIIGKFLKRNPTCAKCGTDKNIVIGHIKPRLKGGKNMDNLISLCKKHHYLFDQLLKNFWD